MMIIDNKFDIGQFVYIRTDPHQEKGMITSIQVHPEGRLMYDVTIKSFTNSYYDFELSVEADVLITTNN